MRHFSLCVAVLFLLSTTFMAQRTSGGGSSSGGSSSGGSSGGGGGGSHGGSSGGASMSSGSGGGHSSGGGSVGGSSGSSHSSGGSNWSGGHSSGGGHASGGAHVSGGGPTSAGSKARSSTVHVSDTPAMINSRTHQAERSETPRELRNQTPTMQPQKRSFFGFLRHPFRKPQPKIVGKVPHPLCLKGPCKVCANGQIAAQGGCAPANATAQQQYGYCSSADVWNGSDCLFQTRFLNNCSAERLSMERQFQRIQVAESVRRSACMTGDNQSCMEAENALRSEQNLYRQLQAQYQQCQMNPGFGYMPGGWAFGRWNRSFGYMGFDSLRYDPFPMDALDFNFRY